MKHRGLDYRISLLSAAAFHGAAQAAQAFELTVPRPLRDFALGRHRLEFVTQAPPAFTKTNRAEWLAEMKAQGVKA